MRSKAPWITFNKEEIDGMLESPGAYQLVQSYRKQGPCVTGACENLKQKLAEHLRNGDGDQFRYFRYLEAGFLEDPRELGTQFPAWK
ncbi:MAG: hypothetical protein IBX68_03555 [Dehalococcoidia bacterium]|nr:hypothetical protein [Dehalococcoidia bacterium]